MLKKGTTPENYENLTISKCKRIVRPLISKIHALNDLNSKYPSILDFNFPHDDSCFQGLLNKININSDGTGKCIDISQFGQPTKVRKLDYRKNTKSYDYDSDYDEWYDLEEPSPVNKNYMSEERELISSMNNLIKPSSSVERLKSLKPYISGQLYQAYNDMFLIFSNIINLLVHTTHKDTDTSTNIPKLSALSSFKIGKFISLSTKTTYYEMNQSLLFDPSTIPHHLREYQDILSDDIDEWLDMQPEIVIHSRRIDILIGYVIHLLVINLDLTLYLLIPTLIHWLNDEQKITGNKKLLSVSRSLFSEYWTYGPGYFEGTGFDNIVGILNGRQSKERNVDIFWIFHKIGYWENLIKSFCSKSTHLNPNSYEILVLDTIPLNNKLKFDVLMKFDTAFNTNDFLHNIYQIIKKNPQHPQVNNILVLIITQLISSTRSNLKQCKSSLGIVNFFQSAYDNIIFFVHIWLSLPEREELLVFNSLYPGNHEIFHALISFTVFQIRQCDILFLNLSKPKNTILSKININRSYKIKLKTIKNDLSLLKKTLELLKLYYLDTFKPFVIDPRDAEQISSLVLLIQNFKLNCSKFKEYLLCNNSYNDFLIWLFDQQDLALLQIAQLCFQKYYGFRTRFKDDMVHNLYCMLFTSNIITGSSSEDIDGSKLDNSNNDDGNDADNETKTTIH